jgi:hypothetical protein
MSHAERAEAHLNDFLKENPQFMEVSSTDVPVILGECSFNSSSPNPHIQHLPEVGPAPSTYVLGPFASLAEPDLELERLAPSVVPS